MPVLQATRQNSTPPSRILPNAIYSQSRTYCPTRRKRGRYEYLKKKLIKRLTDWDSIRMLKLLEGEHMEDREPSRFYRDLKKFATPYTSLHLKLVE